MHTVSVDLARRLASAGLAWEPKVGDWYVDGLGRQRMVLEVGFDWIIVWCVPGTEIVRTGFQVFKHFLWLPTSDDCLEAIRSRGLYPAVGAYPESMAGPAHWGAWVANASDEGIEAEGEGDRPAEATGLALAAILEGEKEGK